MLTFGKHLKATRSVDLLSVLSFSIFMKIQIIFAIKNHVIYLRKNLNCFSDPVHFIVYQVPVFLIAVYDLMINAIDECY